MAHVEGHAIVMLADEPYPEYPGWVRTDCGCCAGLQWGGEEPRECRDCNGGGALAKHVASGVVALYPGGPIRWRDTPHVAPSSAGSTTP